MKIVDVLDVSLRDGGHRTNFHFADKDIQKILTALDESGIEYIEIGYRNGSLNPITNIGKAGLCQKDYLHFCTSLIKKAKIAVMVYPGNVTKEDLFELKEAGVNLIRICVVKDRLAEAFSVLKMAKDLSLNVSINLTNMSQYEEQALDCVVQEVVSCKPDMIYFADSNGSVLPDKVESVYQRYTQLYSIPFGFHAHDNLGLAQANALAAIRAGVKYIDTSLAGMGKGIGNLKTEFFIAYLQAIKMKTYHLETLLFASNYVREVLGIGREPIEIGELIRGISDPV
ncbi:4-hydroxy-2-oxovalerate aldolase [Legionella cardiaca]|uniref:Homocitrate synthase n=1 Tax=Legionella cardiaca TaxID=1071983 RepID=A0ABY8AT28_9GAMM|nr:4-hydroxy-2-oxovalerate aldolase [Legionella cardiaca]WED43703.1 4-hydroxy-2-oxovalerate aldolase [Legionella cardiaca]